MRVNDKCPYNPKHKNTGLVQNKSERLFAVCPMCNRSARVTIYSHADGNKTAKLSKVGRPFTGNAKEKYQIRLSPAEKKALINGRASLTFSNNRIQLLYKT